MKYGLLSMLALSAGLVFMSGARAQEDAVVPDGSEEAGIPASATARALDALTAAYNDLTSRAGEGGTEAVDWAQGDIENLGDWEYRIVDLEGLTAEEMQGELNTLGDDRWEVYWVADTPGGVRFFLKRPSISYLSRVPLSTLLRVLAGGAQ